MFIPALTFASIVGVANDAVGFGRSAIHSSNTSGVLSP
jgi:hypothetical protein